MHFHTALIGVLSAGPVLAREGCLEGKGDCDEGWGLWEGRGFRYNGTFANARFDGIGTITHIARGSSYTGGFVQGTRHGSGVLHYSDGSRFAGEFVSNWIADGSVGEWSPKASDPNGYLFGDDGGGAPASSAALRGKWRSDPTARPPLARLIVARYPASSGAIVACSAATRDAMAAAAGGDLVAAVGIYLYEDSGRYEGELCYDGVTATAKFDGFGSFVYGHSGAAYHGEFSNGLFHGNGAWLSPRGTRMVGEWTGGALHTLGVSRYPTGTEWAGEIATRVKVGHAVLRVDEAHAAAQDGSEALAGAVCAGEWRLAPPEGSQSRGEVLTGVGRAVLIAGASPAAAALDEIGAAAAAEVGTTWWWPFGAAAPAPAPPAALPAQLFGGQLDSWSRHGFGALAPLQGSNAAVAAAATAEETDDVCAEIATLLGRPDGGCCASAGAAAEAARASARTRSSSSGGAGSDSNGHASAAQQSGEWSRAELVTARALTGEEERRVALAARKGWLAACHARRLEASILDRVRGWLRGTSAAARELRATVSAASPPRLVGGAATAAEVGEGGGGGASRDEL